MSQIKYLFRLRPPSPAMIVALVAVFLGLAGGTYAAIGTQQIKNKSISTKKIKGSAVTTAKLAPNERSEGFSKRTLGGTGISLGATEQTVISLSLPASGHYIVNASTGIAGNGATNTAAVRSLRDDGTDIAVGGGSALGSGQISGSVALTGTSDGGTVSLVCSQAIAATTISKNQEITASRVGTLTTQ